MEGLSIEEPGFQDWLQTEREQVPLLACGVYARLLDQAQTAGRLEEALTAGLKLVLLDPSQEHVHRALMRIYAAQGDTTRQKPIWRSGWPSSCRTITIGRPIISTGRSCSIRTTISPWPTTAGF
jgi:DNA-binding SARP family transcriptional activator